MSDPTLSHVSVAFKVCPICYENHDDGVLIHKRLANVLPHKMCTGFELCEDHKAKRADWLGVVEVSQAPPVGETLKPENAKPTGRYAMLKRDVVPKVFNISIGAELDFVYTDVEGFDELMRMGGRR